MSETNKKCGIASIDGITLVIPQAKITKQNIPNKQVVSKEHFYEFLHKNKEHIGKAYNSPVADLYIVQDKYGNIIASVYYYMEKTYSINPELLELGIKNKKFIENEYKIIGEQRIKMSS